MPWDGIVRSMLASTIVSRSSGHIPDGPTGKGRDRTWRGSRSHASRVARAGRRKTRRIKKQ